MGVVYTRNLIVAATLVKILVLISTINLLWHYLRELQHFQKLTTENRHQTKNTFLPIRDKTIKIL